MKRKQCKDLMLFEHIQLSSLIYLHLFEFDNFNKLEVRQYTSPSEWSFLYVALGDKSLNTPGLDLECVRKQWHDTINQRNNFR